MEGPGRFLIPGASSGAVLGIGDEDGAGACGEESSRLAGTAAGRGEEMEFGGDTKSIVVGGSCAGKAPRKQPVPRGPISGKTPRKQPVPRGPISGKTPRKQAVPKMEIVVKSAQCIAFLWKVPREEISDDRRYFARLMVDPTLKIGALKSMLKKYKWAPQENSLIVSEDGKIHLNDDSSTLGEWKVKENDTLLVCGEDGEFTFYVYSNMDMRRFPVSVDSCFNRICDVKEKISQLKGHSPEDQVLTRNIYSVHLQDDIPLVAVGIVKPYMKEMEKKLESGVPLLKLVGPVRKRGSLNGPLIRDFSIPCF